MASYLDGYLESIATLPVDLDRCFTLIRELDEKSQFLLDKVETMVVRNIEEGIELDESVTEETIKELYQDLKVCASLGDERISLAAQAYEQLDKHIARLDQDLKRVEQDLQRRGSAFRGEDQEPKTPSDVRGSLSFREMPDVVSHVESEPM